MKLVLLIAVLLVSRCWNIDKTVPAPESYVSGYDSTLVKKTGDMMEEDLYWAILDRSLKFKLDQEEQEAFLIEEIGALDPREIIGFHLRTRKLLYDTYTSNMWCAGFLMNGGCSDDGFEYFRCWMISRGKEVYEKTNYNPDNLVGEVSGGMEYYEFEGFLYVAVTAFLNKTGKSIFSYVDYEAAGIKEYPHIEFTWHEDRPESMQKLCPRLFEKCWKQAPNGES